MPPLLGARASGRRGGHGLELRVDLLTWNGAQNSGDDDAILRLEPALDHAQVAHFRTDHDFALLDRIVLVEHEQVTPSLVGTERVVRHQ